MAGAAARLVLEVDANGNLSMSGSPAAPLVQLGMLEMAKSIIYRQLGGSTEKKSPIVVARPVIRGPGP